MEPLSECIEHESFVLNALIYFFIKKMFTHQCNFLKQNTQVESDKFQGSLSLMVSLLFLILIHLVFVYEIGSLFQYLVHTPKIKIKWLNHVNNVTMN